MKDSLANPPSVEAKTSRPLRILVVRPDKLGDVILSTPVLEALKRHYPHSKITAMVRENVKPLIDRLPSVTSVLTYDPTGRHKGLRGFWRLYKEIRSFRFRIAVLLQTQFKIAAAVYLANIRFRLGPYSKFHSYFFFNRGLRQKRSQVEMHESDYNLQLLRRLGIRVSSRKYPVSVHLSDEAKQKSLKWLETQGWSPAFGRKLVVVHPGMGGSALNWPEDCYLELIADLSKDGYQVLITTGPAEGDLLRRIQDGLLSQKLPVIYYSAEKDAGIDDLGAILHWASLVIAPSTGPLHLAVALGRPVVTFYPPIRVQSAIRWGPYLADESRASILVPEVYCGEDFGCRGSLCNYYPCMRGLLVSQAMEEVRRQLARPTPEK